METILRAIDILGKTLDDHMEYVNKQNAKPHRDANVHS